MDEPTLQRTLREKYNISDRLLAEGRFVGLIGDHATSLVCLGLGIRCLVVAKIVLSGDVIDYDLISITPLPLISWSFQNIAKKVKIRSQFKSTQVFQMCTSANQAEVWDNFTSTIKDVYMPRQSETWCSATLHSPKTTQSSPTLSITHFDQESLATSQNNSRQKTSGMSKPLSPGNESYTSATRSSDSGMLKPLSPRNESSSSATRSSDSSMSKTLSPGNVSYKSATRSSDSSMSTPLSPRNESSSFTTRSSDSSMSKTLSPGNESSSSATRSSDSSMSKTLSPGNESYTSTTRSSDYEQQSFSQRSNISRCSSTISYRSISSLPKFDSRLSESCVSLPTKLPSQTDEYNHRYMASPKSYSVDLLDVKFERFVNDASTKSGDYRDPYTTCMWAGSADDMIEESDHKVSMSNNFIEEIDISFKNMSNEGGGNEKSDNRVRGFLKRVKFCCTGKKSGGS